MFRLVVFCGLFLLLGILGWQGCSDAHIKGSPDGEASTTQDASSTSETFNVSEIPEDSGSSDIQAQESSGLEFLEKQPEKVVEAPVEKKPPYQNKELRVREIPLTGPISSANSEISSMAWYKDHLILLPQYPHLGLGGGKGRLYAIPKQTILDYLDGKSIVPIRPKEISFETQGLRVSGYEGFEAITFLGDNVYLTIESRPSRMLGLLVSGKIQSDLSRIQLNVQNVTQLASQTGISNFTDETILFYNNQIFTVHEGNGKWDNRSPIARVFDLSLRALKPISFPTVEYRVTDATSVDSKGIFWVINYDYPGTRLRRGPDTISQKYPKGPTHQRNRHVERLLEMRITPDKGIVLTETPPIQLELINNVPRNWEGLVRLPGRGFLLATDKFPKTTLAFVPGHGQ